MPKRGGGEVRPPGFQYLGSDANQQLACEKSSLSALATRFGTPLYVYSEASIRERFKVLDRAFRSFPHDVCYSVKANSNLALLRLLSHMGAGFDVVSGGELQRVLRVSRKAAAKMVFSGVGKTAEEMDEALRAKILLFNVESESELALLAQRAARQKKQAPVALRINPDVPADTHPYISTGLREHKFGIPIERALAIYRQAARWKQLDMCGISLHIGSQICETEPFAAAMERLSELARRLQEERFTIRYIDAGGGLGIPYNSADDFAARVASYAAAVLTPLRKLKVRLLLEPGRAIVGPAGVLLTRVLYLKQNGNKRFIVVDAAMNDFIRPALYSAHHEIIAVRPGGGNRSNFDVVGPICESGDFFARDREMEEPRAAEVLAILDTGAYGMSLASNYNSRPRPAEVLVKGKNARLIRRRETMRDLMTNERL